MFREWDVQSVVTIRSRRGVAESLRAILLVVAAMLVVHTAHATAEARVGRRFRMKDFGLMARLSTGCWLTSKQRNALADHYDRGQYDRDMAVAFRRFGLELDKVDPKERGTTSQSGIDGGDRFGDRPMVLPCADFGWRRPTGGLWPKW